MELRNFLSYRDVTSIEVDHSEDSTFQINFNFTFPHMSCDFASIDYANVIGKESYDISDQTIAKYALDGTYHGMASTDDSYVHLYEGTDKDHYGNARHAIELTPTSFSKMVDEFEVVLVDFHAPWCPHCRNLAPIFEHAADLVKERAPHEADNHHKHSVALATFDCTIPAHQEICRQNQIQGFPTILVFRQSKSKLVQTPRGQYHESYTGRREAEAIATFAIETLKSVQREDKDAMPQIGKSIDTDKDGKPDSKIIQRGCRIAGFLKVQRVPGHITFRPKSDGHSFEPGLFSMEHSINILSFGKIHPGSIRDLNAGPYSDKPIRPLVLAEGQEDILFSSDNHEASFDHYIKVVSTTRIAKNNEKIQAYEYTMNSNVHNTSKDNRFPEVVISYDISPLMVLVRQEGKPWIEGLTAMCAILGGVYTSSVIVEALLSGAISTLTKKMD